MTSVSSNAYVPVDVDLVQTLAASNGLALSTKRAADLVPAVQAILDADARLTALDLGTTTTAGLPWGVRQEEHSP